MGPGGEQNFKNRYGGSNQRGARRRAQIVLVVAATRDEWRGSLAPLWTGGSAGHGGGEFLAPGGAGGGDGKLRRNTYSLASSKRPPAILAGPHTKTSHLASKFWFQAARGSALFDCRRS